MIGVSVIRDDQTKGKVVGEDNGYLIIEFEDSSRIIIAPDLLTSREDGTYFVPFDVNIAQELILPVIDEEIIIEKEQIPRGIVRVTTKVETREKEVDATTNHEKIVVEHVPVNKLVEDVVPRVRKERGVLIIPVVEEVVVIEKRLMLIEEVHISKERSQKTTPHTVMLRRAIVEIDRLEAEGTELAQEREFEDL